MVSVISSGDNKITFGVSREFRWLSDHELICGREQINNQKGDSDIYKLIHPLFHSPIISMLRVQLFCKRNVQYDNKKLLDVRPAKQNFSFPVKFHSFYQ